jgi:NAD(P)-dependent dehydrogenase (short-subunit alcohol dehydrogenase family)
MGAKNFQEKVVVITGAGSGIGRATALAFARQGARVHVVDIRKDRLDDVGGEMVTNRLGCTLHEIDCRDARAVEELARAVFAEEGRVDILHNNAGVVRAGFVASLSLSDWREILEVNLWSVIHGIRAFVPRMIAQGGGGHIVNTASLAGLVGFPAVAPYCASKFAVVGLSESLALELAPHGIHVTVVCPGMVRTNLLQGVRLKLPNGTQDIIEKAIERYGTRPERVAADILEAVRKKKFLQICGAEALPLWWLKRFSSTIFFGAAHLLARSTSALSARSVDSSP